MRISVIIPVYNAEKTIEKALGSLSRQFSQDVESVLVNDGSTDSTRDILEAFSNKHMNHCHVIQQDNAGAAAARNRAISVARGDYLTFLDSDDQFEPNALDRILGYLDDKPDIIGWDWSNDTDGKRRHMRQADYNTPEGALRNLMGGTMKWNLWLFAVKRELIVENAINFIPGADMGEDMAFMLKAFACASRVKQVHESLYVYNASNPSSISAQLDERRRDEVSRNLESAEAFLANGPYKQLAMNYLPHLKLYIKLPLLIGFSKENYRLWYRWMSDVNSYAMANKALPLRTRVLQGLAAGKRYWALYLYNLLYLAYGAIRSL